MTTQQKHTPELWHVNAIKAGRIVGDETAEAFDKLQIHAANCTVATVYRAKDARLVAAAPAMADAIRTAAQNASVIQLGEYAGMIMLRREDYDALENALDAATGEYSAIKAAEGEAG